MKQKFSIVVVMMIALCWGHDAFAQKAKRAKKSKAPKVEVAKVVEEVPVAPVDTVVVDTVVPVAPPEPQDRLDTIYYNRNWKVTKNKAFANYYRLALYPADSTAAKEFRTYYMTGELQGEGVFVELDKADDTKSEFKGLVTNYFKNGKLKEQKTFENGKLTNEYTSYYENGNVKEHFFMKEGKKLGVGAVFTEDGRVCTLTPYKNDASEGFYVVVDADGNYSKYSSTDNQPILETP